MNITHPNLITIYGWYIDATYLYIIYEYHSETNILKKIAIEKSFNSDIIAFIIKQIILVLNYCIESSIIYSNLTPFHIYFSSEEQFQHIVKMKNPEFEAILQECLKIPHYSALLPYYESPEDFTNPPTNLSSMWSVGVIAFQLLTGKLPFTGMNDHEIRVRVCVETYSLKRTKIKHVSENRDYL